MEPQQPAPQPSPSNQPQNQMPEAGIGQIVTPTATPQQAAPQPGYPGAMPSPMQSPQPSYAPTVNMPQQPTRSRKTRLVVIAVVVLLAVGAGLIFALSHGKKNNNTSNTGSTGTTTNSSNTSSFTPASAKACDAFTLTAAQATLGSSAQASSLNGAADTSTTDQSISSCGYQVTNGANVTTANVSITGALTQSGQTLNTSAFSALKSKDNGTAVAGIGDQAFYDSKTNTLTVLKGSYSIVVTYLAESNGSISYGQSQAEQIAKAVVATL